MVDNKKEVNIYRDTPVRYLGYANEVGEAFRSIVHRTVVWSSYFVATGYVLADTIHGAKKIYDKEPSKDKTKNILLSSSDTLLWQGFASVIVPGLTINRICALVQFIQRKSLVKGPMGSPWIPTIIGLASIPMIIKPIDDGVEDVMDMTFRKWTGYHPHHSFESKDS